MAIFTIILAAFLAFGVNGASVSDKIDPAQGTELVYAFMVHRHGDRTPDSFNTLATFNLDNDEVHALIDQWGYGQLTNVGKNTAFKTGEFIRRRYDSLIAPRYNDSEIYIHSSDVTRTKMSALAAMAAVFRPVGKSWSEDVNWVPVPYTTVPGKEDLTLSAVSSCVRVVAQQLIGKLFSSSGPTAEFEKKYQDPLTKLARVLGQDNTLSPFQVFMAWADLSALVSMNYDIGDELSELYPELFDAFDASWAYMFGDEEVLTAAAGVLLNEFFVNADKIIAGQATQSVRVYSAHDLNVWTLQAASMVTPQGRPLYGSLYSLELRRIEATGEYVVLPVYLSDPKVGQESYLRVNGCSDFLCNYEQFRNITSAHRIDEQALKQKCSAGYVTLCLKNKQSKREYAVSLIYWLDSLTNVILATRRHLVPYSARYETLCPTQQNKRNKRECAVWPARLTNVIQATRRQMVPYSARYETLCPTR
ncbi:histidine phosphatase superfamily (branch 2) domain-containing protein [Phthorimaea operculella]|nr:histidine phosphatase superfamily (branch 2) domain-containing protein [Phthorimaea operculella]